MSTTLFEIPEAPVGAPPPEGLRFWLDCVPPTTSHHRKRIVRVGKFSRLADAPELNHAKSLLESLLLPYQGAPCMAGPVRLELTWVWPWRSSDPKRLVTEARARSRDGLGRYAIDTRPDLSNLTKTIEDRLVALRFIVDDGHVAIGVQRKFRGDRPGIGIAIRPLTDAERWGLDA